MKQTKLLRVSIQTKNRLDAKALGRETYDKQINRLLDILENYLQTTR